MVILLVGIPGRNSACGEALGLKWISVSPMYVVVCSPGGFLSGSICTERTLWGASLVVNLLVGSLQPYFWVRLALDAPTFGCAFIAFLKPF